MKVLILSPYPEQITRAIDGSEIRVSMDMPQAIDWFWPDFVVSYGYHYILHERICSHFGERIINLHISMLPWNRGADPNLWSWHDHTPKGVTIHQITAGLDTGPIFAQRAVSFDNSETIETLRTTYARLQTEIAALFAEVWDDIRDGKLTASAQDGIGSYHRSSDKHCVWDRLPLGFDTPVQDIIDMGAETAISSDFWRRYEQDIAAERVGS